MHCGKIDLPSTTSLAIIQHLTGQFFKGALTIEYNHAVMEDIKNNIVPQLDSLSWCFKPAMCLQYTGLVWWVF